MTTLKYNESIVKESNSSVIENLLRKGWSIVENLQDTEPPEYDAATQKLIFHKETSEYEVVDLTQEELAAIAKQKKLTIFYEKLNDGFLVEPEDFVLGLQEPDRSAFSQMLALVKEALDLGLISNDTPQTIKDINGQPQQLSTLRFRQIMVAYGFYYKQLWDQLV